MWTPVSHVQQHLLGNILKFHLKKPIASLLMLYKTAPVHAECQKEQNLCKIKIYLKKTSPGGFGQ